MYESVCGFVYISTFGKVQLLTLAAYRVQRESRGEVVRLLRVCQSNYFSWQQFALGFERDSLSW